MVEASVRKLRSLEYMQAARLFGSSGLRTAVRHLLPNLVTEVVVMASSAVGWAVLTATTLSFLGLGVQLPRAGLGQRPGRGRHNLSTAWWLSTFPGLAITVTILVANFAGDWVMTLTGRAGRTSGPRRSPAGVPHRLPSAPGGQAAALPSAAHRRSDILARPAITAATSGAAPRACHEAAGSAGSPEVVLDIRDLRVEIRTPRSTAVDG